jgi:hypothetical protein
LQRAQRKNNYTFLYQRIYRFNFGDQSKFQWLPLDPKR